MDKPSPRPIWTGSISFGLVTIPVKLHTAVREKTLHFRSLHDQDKTPLKQKMYCPTDGKDVHPEHIVKGYEIEKDRFVVVRDEELEAAAPKATKAIEIQDFVDLEEIDPLFFDRPYYVVPTPAGVKPFNLLLEAMQKTKKVGIAKVVMFRKQHLCALRPIESGMCLETMHFDDEVLPASSAGADQRVKVDDRELKMATQLIESLGSKFDASRYRDDYREQVMALIEKKAEGEHIVTRPAPDAHVARNGHDLVAALEASLAESRNGSKANGNGSSKTSRSSGKSRAEAAATTPKRRKSA